MNIVKVYSIENCPYCIELKQMLTTENIKFIDIDINLPENEAEFNKLYEITQCDEVPVVKVGKQILVPNTSFNSIQECYELTKKFLI
jgi:glutaredoxin